MTSLRSIFLGLCLAIVAACGRGDHIGKAPSFSNNDDNPEQLAMMSPGLPLSLQPHRNIDEASLWSGTRQSLLGDRRAIQRGDILTVVIEIDERAEISNETERSRSGSESLGVEDFFGLPQRIDPGLPNGASLADAVSIKRNIRAVTRRGRSSCRPSVAAFPPRRTRGSTPADRGCWHCPWRPSSTTTGCRAPGRGPWSGHPTTPTG